MAKKQLQRTGEIIMFQGDEFTRRIPINDASGSRVNLTGATAITLKAFEFFDDTAEEFSITGSVYDDGAEKQLQFVFTDTLTSTMTPQTYVYYVSFTLAGSDITVARDLLTVKRKQT